MNKVDQYLERINYQGPRTNNAETLKGLHLAHLYSVPFENLSIHAGEPIVLNSEALFEKIVTNRRGGFCYEDNGLFAWLLSELGFDVTMLSARVANANGDFGPEFDHMTLLVQLEDRWLCDVGFGETFREPLLVDNRSPQVLGANAFRIDSAGEDLTLFHSINGGEWRPEYRFTLQPHDFRDYEEMCHYHQTSPDSHFTRGRLCSLATPDGRLTLSGMKLITTSTVQQVRDEVDVASDIAYAELLRDKFGVQLKMFDKL